MSPFVKYEVMLEGVPPRGLEEANPNPGNDHNCTLATTMATTKPTTKSGIAKIIYV
jgi:hypothetical protein